MKMKTVMKIIEMRKLWTCAQNRWLIVMCLKRMSQQLKTAEMMPLVNIYLKL